MIKKKAIDIVKGLSYHHFILIVIIVSFFPILLSLYHNVYSNYSYYNILVLLKDVVWIQPMILIIDIILMVLTVIVISKLSKYIFGSRTIKNIFLLLLILSPIFILNITSISIIPLLVFLFFLFIYLMELFIYTRKVRYFIISVILVLALSFFDGFNLFFLIFMALFLLFSFLSHLKNREHYILLDYRILYLFFIIILFIIKSIFISLNSDVYLSEKWLRDIISFSSGVTLSYIALAILSLSIIFSYKKKNKIVTNFRIFVLLVFLLNVFFYIFLKQFPLVGYNYSIYISFVIVNEICLVLLASFALFYLLIYEWKFKFLKFICYVIVISLILFNVVNTNKMIINNIKDNMEIIKELKEIDINDGIIIAHKDVGLIGKIIYKNITFIPREVNNYRMLKNQTSLYHNIINVKKSKDFKHYKKIYDIKMIIIDDKLIKDIEDKENSILNFLTKKYVDVVYKGDLLKAYLFK